MLRLKNASVFFIDRTFISFILFIARMGYYAIKVMPNTLATCWELAAILKLLNTVVLHFNTDIIQKSKK
jgi:hypothetical protein